MKGKEKKIKEEEKKKTNLIDYAKVVAIPSSFCLSFFWFFFFVFLFFWFPPSNSWYIPFL